MTDFPRHARADRSASRDAVTLEGVSKIFGQHRAVDDLTLSIPAGSCYGFIGPNGSGKTTTLRMIMRILQQDEGVVRVLDRVNDARPDDRVGYLPEERGLYKQMKVGELLKFYANIKGYRPPRGEVEAWLDRMGLGGWGNKKVEQLSKGMSQKVQFIATVISGPQLVVLDEVFSGLDPVNREVMTSEILRLRRDGVTVIFSTHDMSVAEQMCDRVFMIYKGKKVLDGTLDDIRRERGTGTVRVCLEGVGAETMHGLPGVAGVRDLGGVQELRLAPAADEQALLTRLMNLGRVIRFEVGAPTLQDIFVDIAKPPADELQPGLRPEPADAA